MSYRIEEAKSMADRVRKTARILRGGSQYASEPQYHRAKELVAQGAIGKPLWAQGTYCRNTFHGEWNYEIDPQGTEDAIDWKRFLGSAPKRPFSQDRYFRWRKYWDYSGGIATDLLYQPARAISGDVGAAVPCASLLQRRNLRPQRSRSARHGAHNHRLSGISADHF